MPTEAEATPSLPDDPEAIEALWTYSQETLKQAVDHFERLDEKIQQYFSFGGVIVALLLSSTGTVLEYSENGGWFAVATGLFFLAIVAISIGIVFGLRAYFLRSIEALPSPTNIVNWYSGPGCKDKSKGRLLKLFISKAGRSVETYNRMASEKAIPLRGASYCFVAGIVALILFIASFGFAHIVSAL